MMITIIDYGSGNLHSVEKAFSHAADKVGQTVVVTSDPDTLRQASHIVLPGVGAFADCMNGLRAVNGMVEALQESVIEKGTYFLGICVGMQMMLERGLEHGEYAGLGWIAGDVVPIEFNKGRESRVESREEQEGRPAGRSSLETALLREQEASAGSYRVSPEGQTQEKFKIPHMGWNELELLQPDNPIFVNIKNGDHVYFVHSYHAKCTDQSAVLARVDYGEPICACIGKDNMIGTQFHPEKSHMVGLQLIENFVRQ